MDVYQVNVMFQEPVLGTIPLNEEFFREYVAKQMGEEVTPEDLRRQAEELGTLPEVMGELLEKGTTGFHQEGGFDIIYDYVVKGFMKDACGMLRRSAGTLSSRLTAYKKNIDGLVFVEPRKIRILAAGEKEFLTRPLRAQTLQGERVALARSEMLPEGSTMSFKIHVFPGTVTENHLREWFDYGRWRGFGQWRNGGYGKFSYHMEREQ